MPVKPDKLKLPWVPERKAFGGRHRDNSKFYNSWPWRKFAKLFRQKNPYCRHCEEKGMVGPAQVVDHIQGLNFLLDNNINPMDPAECQSLCHPCHNIKSGKESHGYREEKIKINSNPAGGTG